jgi:TATA-binding protein-associated factor Taf7
MSSRQSRKTRAQDPPPSESLDEQLVIRFPPDIAERLNSNSFDTLDIRFIDSTHATVTVFDETLSGTLLSLPTIVETYRTTDGSHGHKSGDIEHILIVHRPDSPPTDFSTSFVCDHGLTPPTADIIAKRAARMEASRAGEFAADVEYWEQVETQLLALTGHCSGRPTRRTEELEEPAIDPVRLEKILRKSGHPEFAGYSGTEIHESDLETDDLDVEKLSLSVDEDDDVAGMFGSTEGKQGDEEEQGAFSDD